MTKIWESRQVSGGTPAYADARLQAERAAAFFRKDERTGPYAVRWDDNYDDTGMRGRWAVYAC